VTHLLERRISREEGNHQNNSFNANWIWRDVVEVLVITPAEEL